MLKNSYLCSVEKKDGNARHGSENLVSGLPEFNTCPERKKFRPEVDKVS